MPAEAPPNSIPVVSDAVRRPDAHPAWRSTEAVEVDFHAMVEDDAREQDERGKDEDEDEDPTSGFRNAVALDGEDAARRPARQRAPGAPRLGRHP